MILFLRSVRYNSATKSARAPIILPEFLVPALSSRQASQPFSTSSPYASRIGGASLSLPPEVDLRVLEPPTSRRKTTITRTEPPKIVEVEGPLGEQLAEYPSKEIQ